MMHKRSGKRLVTLLSVLMAGTVSPTGAPAQSIYYSRSGTSIPYSSSWNGSSWGSATALPTLANNGFWFQAARSPSGSEISLAAVDANKTIKIMFNTSGSFATPSTLVAESGSNSARRFAVAYEQQSGDCMVAYSTGGGNKLDYRTATGGALSSAATAFSGSHNFDVVKMVAKPGTDELMLMAADVNKSLSARVWTGSSWGSTSVLYTNVGPPNVESFAGAYEASSGDGLVVYNDLSTYPRYRTYASGTWSAQANLTACSAAPQYIRLAAKPGSNECVCGILDNNKRIRMYVWNGSTWVSSLEIETNAGYSDRRPFDVGYQPDGLNALVVYSDNSSGSFKHRTYNGTSWSSATSTTGLGGKLQWVQVVPGASGGEMFVLGVDLGSDLHAWKWDGSTLGAKTTLESSLGGTLTTEPCWLLGPTTSTKKKIIKWREVPNPDPLNP